MAGPIIEVECWCKGNNPACEKCNGTGRQKKIGCLTCGGTGYNGGVQKAGKCLDCRGHKYRDIDNGALLGGSNEVEL